VPTACDRVGPILKMKADRMLLVLDFNEEAEKHFKSKLHMGRVWGITMSVASSRKRNQVKGALFEVIVRSLLIQAGYLPIKADDIHVRKSDGHVRGRGYWHDIDALGRSVFPLIYLYPIRLLAEVKCYEDNVPLPALRSFVGALKDISENYFVEDKISRAEMLAYQRYTDCGSFFSATGFTIGAQKFALAQGVFLISYDSNPILRRIIDSMYRLIDFVDVDLASKRKTGFSRWIQGHLGSPLKSTYVSTFVPSSKHSNFVEEFETLHTSLSAVQTSSIAMIVGEEAASQYPIHMLSYQKIPERVFAGRDDHFFRVYFTETATGLFFEVIPTEAKETSLFFSLPKHIYARYFAERRMLDFKKKYITQIEFPATIEGVRRILRLNLDREWVRRQQES
jgi:hypothetical protein